MQDHVTISTPPSLISSSDVNGTNVYSLKGDHLGHIDHLMIDRKSGQIAFAVMHFGGFLGIGEGEHALPWKKLRYDTNYDGFVTDLTAEEINGAPARGDDWHDDGEFHRRSYDYYGLPGYWL